MKQKQPPNPNARKIVLQFRVNVNEMNEILKRQKVGKHPDMSEYLRACALKGLKKCQN